MSVEEDTAAIRAMVAGETPPKMGKREKMLERVRGILALADDEQLRNPKAADEYRRKADEIMSAYALEQWMVDTTNKSGAARPELEIRYMDFTWWYRNNFSNDLMSMFQAVAQHCRCVIGWRGQGKDGNYHHMPIIGLPSDIDYMDMLFTHLMLQMGRQLEPKPEPSISFAENCYRLRISGMERRRVAQLLWESSIDIPGVDTSQPFDNTFSPITKKALRTIRKYAEEYASEQGLETTKVSPQVWQRSFSRGFVLEIRARLRDMFRLNEDRKDASGNPFAVALRDIYSMALEKYEEQWPPPPPIKVDSTAVVKSSRRTKLPAGPTYNSRGLNAGREAGRKANLSNKPSERIGNRQSLPEES